MNLVLISAVTLAWLSILVVGWLGWQLLRQNGRLLLRLEELETQLDELEFGGDGQPTGLPLGSEAPAFELADLAGGSKSLKQFRGESVLSIFFNPACGFCRDMVPKLKEKVESRSRKAEMEGGSECPLLLIVSTGDAEENRRLFDEHGFAGPVLLQKDSEVATAYQANGTPSGYLIDPEGKLASELALGADTLLALATGKSPRQSGRPLTPALSPDGGESVRRTGEGAAPDLAHRFRDRSLARSKIKRDGLKAGTPAPDFRLPRLDGKGELSLSELRGKRVLLVFSSPGCGPCNALAPELEKFHRKHGDAFPTSRAPDPESEHITPPLSPRGGERVRRTGEGEFPRIEVVMISKGEPKENRSNAKEFGLTLPIVLQQQWEISRRYAMFATPIAYLIDESGVIAHDVAVGTDAVLELLRAAPGQPTEQEVAAGA